MDTTKVIDSGASSSFVKDKNELTNALPHKTTLTTATGEKLRQNIHATFDNQPIFLPAFTVLKFDQSLISVSQLERRTNIIFTKQSVYLSKKLIIHYDAKLFGTLDTTDNLFKRKKENKNLSAFPSIVTLRED